jgi:hypothetical protein
MVMLILLVWRIGFRVTGMEIVGVMPTVQVFVRCDVGSLWIVIIPEEPEKATRGGVNGSQSKLLIVTWPISQT